MHTDTRFAWLRLNVDGVLIAVFGLIMAADILHPDVTDLALSAGSVPTTFYLWSTLYVAASVLMMFGFITHKIGPELAGRLALCLGLAMETARTISILGLNRDATMLTVVTIAVTALSIARTSVLLSRRGVTVMIPPGRGPR